MLQRENDLRRAPETQMKMEEAEESAITEWMDVVEDVQKQVVKEFRTKFSPSSGVITINDLRNAAMRYPDIAHWVKYNRVRRGRLKVGDVAPDVPVRYANSCQATTLFMDKEEKGSGSDSSTSSEKSEKNSKPIVIAAGSLS